LWTAEISDGRRGEMFADWLAPASVCLGGAEGI
jgi:hypothetical protein